MKASTIFTAVAMIATVGTFVLAYLGKRRQDEITKQICQKMNLSC